MGGANTIEYDNVAVRSGLGTSWAGNGVSAQGAGRGVTSRAPMSRTLVLMPVATVATSNAGGAGVAV
jgi:hypothetical protein